MSTSATAKEKILQLLPKKKKSCKYHVRSLLLNLKRGIICVVALYCESSVFATTGTVCLNTTTYLYIAELRTEGLSRKFTIKLKEAGTHLESVETQEWEDIIVDRLIYLPHQL